MKWFLSPLLAFSYQVKQWDTGYTDIIDTVNTDSGTLFLTRNRHLQWFNPTKCENGDNRLHDRYLPKTVRSVEVRSKVMVVNMLSEDKDYVSESIVFSRGERFNMKWDDNTLMETILDCNQYLIRSNYLGKIHYGPSPEDMHVSVLRMPSRKPYTTMTVSEPLLWCAGDEHTPEKGIMTRIDAYSLLSSSGKDYLNPIPIYTFLVDRHECSQPLHLKINILPKGTLYTVIGYAIGGACVAHVPMFPPVERQKVLSSHWIRCCHEIPSIALDYPYLYILERGKIHMYHIPTVSTMPSYSGTYTVCLPFEYKHVTQIVAMKRHVFWNGESILRGLELI